MAFWLARQRDGQESDFIQRFDPRFWTVDFPRPMMASVVASDPDGLYVSLQYYHHDALAGLIWESEDRWDHPLLAYTTDRDYSRTTLSFRWRSSGVRALDAVHGPTLTIEGEDAAGNPRSWFVRLWNYATGTPTDAEIVLPFSDLAGGWDIATDPDPVKPSRIDRMFISLVPPSYDPDNPNLLPSRSDAAVRITQIDCQGERAMLEIGDAMLPPHGVRMATAYDDAYNQTPQRLIRTIRGLGYRDQILHYVGMSHYPELVQDGAGGLVANRTAAEFCKPALIWHYALFDQARAGGYEVIASISFELLAQYCPPDWMQRDADGAPALTGWEPPSSLLSHTNPECLAYLRAMVRSLGATQQQFAIPVKIQVGEPWWWINADGAPCIYDDTARAAFADAAPAIADIRDPLTPAQSEVLRQGSVKLGESVQTLRDEVKTAFGEDAEALVLLFTPTILDPENGGVRRLNLPAAWVHPVFHRLQVEDYDWLTGGAEAKRRAAYQVLDAEYGYPLADQDYLAGFVLRPEDAEIFWARIDAGLDEAAARGVPRLFVWALPQVCRDGYVRLAPGQQSPKDDDMQAFDEVYYPLALGRDSGVSPEFSTSVTLTSSGHERRTSQWTDARLRFDVGPGIRSENELGTLIAFFRARRGAARGFLLPDPFDHSSNAMTGTPTMLDQRIGTGDGLTATFRLTKSYGDIDEPQLRPITRPRSGSVVVSVDGVAVEDWTLEAGGRVVFAQAPASGAIVRAGFIFDVPVRFAEDRLDITGAAFAAGEAPSVPLIEIREEQA